MIFVHQSICEHTRTHLHKHTFFKYTPLMDVAAPAGSSLSNGARQLKAMARETYRNDGVENNVAGCGTRRQGRICTQA